MGKVMENIKLTNDYDFALALAGGLDPAKVRTVEIEALVDTGATTLILPAEAVERLGLPVRGHRKVRYADDRVETVPWVVGVKLEIRGREAVVSALVGPAGSTPLIGQIPARRDGLRRRSQDRASCVPTPTPPRTRRAAGHPARRLVADRRNAELKEICARLRDARIPAATHYARLRASRSGESCVMQAQRPARPAAAVPSIGVLLTGIHLHARRARLQANLCSR